MRRWSLNIVRLLLATLALASVWVHRLTPTPDRTIQTAAKRYRDDSTGLRTAWTLRTISDDQRQVIWEKSVGDHFDSDDWLELIDLDTGTNCSPAHWSIPARYAGPARSHRGPASFAHLLHNREGREFLLDANAWRSLDNRFRAAMALEDDPEPALPSTLRFSSDARFLEYQTLGDRPMWFVDCFSGDAIVVEETRTGQRIAKFDNGSYFGHSHSLFLVDERPGNRFDEQLLLTMRDVRADIARFELLLPSRPVALTFNDRYVIAQLSTSTQWWDATNGRLLGEYPAQATPWFVENGQTAVFQSRITGDFEYFDAWTGESRETWNPLGIGRPSDLIFAIWPRPAESYAVQSPKSFRRTNGRVTRILDRLNVDRPNSREGDS